jgi:hypothetical protein
MRTIPGKTFCFLVFVVVGFIFDDYNCFAQQNRQQVIRRQGRGMGQQTPPPVNNQGQTIRRISLDSLIGNIVLGNPTDKSVNLNIIAEKGMAVFVEYGTNKLNQEVRTDPVLAQVRGPIELKIDNLRKNTKYYYRVNLKSSDGKESVTSSVYSFNTQRTSGSEFSFGVQGDSHPERAGKMFNPELYKITMRNVVSGEPDFYFTLGDDFSIDGLISRNQISQESVDNMYLNQRQYLGIVGSNSPVFLVNGNHEQAARYLLNGTKDNPAIYAALARLKYYSLPAPDNFYSGDKEEINFLGLPGDYYAFEWGDALFVVIDFYWHSAKAVDNVAGNLGPKRSNMWDITLGEIQYQWFKKTLEKSKARYKFVFSHHVLGTGRGGVERAKFYEWGGYNQAGEMEFTKMRPGWESPIHQLMVKNKVTVFFQGHDHLYARQELDGIIYQSVPNPADDTYTAFNAGAYKTGKVLPNSGYLKVTVSPEQIKVDYISSFLAKSADDSHKNCSSAYSYIIR